MTLRQTFREVVWQGRRHVLRERLHGPCPLGVCPAVPAAMAQAGLVSGRAPVRRTSVLDR